MSEFNQLAPQPLWQWFAQICAIPHPSHHEEALAEFVQHWAKEQGFFAERDEAGNLLIRKPATAGMENRKGIALQAHFDMVPQANEDTAHNFLQDPIQPYVDGEWVKARGTTLGADNGIGLASALAVLASRDLAHPELEVLLTMTEEAGMDGAKGLRADWLKSPIMINTDTEENGEIYMGCAGGVDANAELEIQWESNRFAHSYQLVLKGLRGGHSGGDIHTGRANAIKVLARFLAELKQNQPHFVFQLAEIRGGSVRNAIPREAFATLVFDGNPEQLQSAVEKFEQLLQSELALVEPNLSFKTQACEKAVQVFNAATTNTAIHWLNSLPNGVIRNSDVLPGVVESSLSLGIVHTTERHLCAIMLVRSLIESGKSLVRSQLESVSSLAGASVAFRGNYPGWAPSADSEIMQLTKQLYDEVLGEESVVKVIHAGLECGLIKEKYPEIDVVSIGPTIRNAHSPDEKVHIPAVQTYWSLLEKILANAPEK